MPAKRKAASLKETSSATIGFEAKLWLTADKLRNNMDAAEYSRAERDRSPKATRRVGAEAPINHVVLGLIFLKYISDTFEEHRAKLLAGQGDYAGANAEDPDEYNAENVFWVPADARWSHIQASAKQPSIGKPVDDAMVAIERDNPRLKGVLPKDYARPGLDKHRLGELIDLIGGIDLVERAPSSPTLLPAGEGSEEAHYRGGYDFSGLLKLAREIRKKKTPAEDLLWELLRDRQLCNAKFRRQHQFGDYLCDFYCHDAKLVVECDGEPHYTSTGKQHDAKRDAYLKSQGLTVLHFENDRVLNDTDAVLQEIAAHLPSPGGRGAGGEGRQGHDTPADPRTHRSVDILGRVYEYFLTMFASAEGKNGGQFYTPSCVVRCLVEMLAPYKGRIYDPACGSGGMFVLSEKFVESHGGKLGDISIYGQDKWARRQRPFGLAKRARRVRLRRQQPKQSNATTRRLAVMNLALRGIEADFGPEHADTFRRDLHPDLRADYVLANPPFNDSDWHRKDDDVRWQPSGARSTAKGSPQGERGGVHQFGVPPKGNANFAWVQHFIHHLAPQGMAGFVLANGSMSSNQSGEGDIRRALIEADLVDCMVALPGQLFYSTQIPVCLWFLAKNKNADAKRGFRDRRKQTLFIDARKLGTLIDRVHRELTDADLEKITSTYHVWRGDSGAPGNAKLQLGSSARNAELELGAPVRYTDIPGFCRSATTAEIAAHGHCLTPGRYVGAEEVEDDGDPFEEKMPCLVAELHAQFAESAKLEQAIKANLRGLGYGG